MPPIAPSFGASQDDAFIEEELVEVLCRRDRTQALLGPADRARRVARALSGRVQTEQRARLNA